MNPDHRHFAPAGAYRRTLSTAMRFAVLAAALVSGLPIGAGAADLSVPPEVRAVLAAPDRSAEDRETDKRRHPAELLAFAGVRPGMTVLDMGTGGGYTAELLARAVGPEGKVIAQNDPPVFEKYMKGKVPPRFAGPAMRNVLHVVRASDDPLPEGAGALDLVTMVYWYHDTVWLGRDRARMNKTLLGALKPGGIVLIVDHAANPGAGASETETLHRIEAGVVKQEMLAAGFEFAGEADFLANPNDPRDAPFFKATVPVDGFVLRFRKP